MCGEGGISAEGEGRRCRSSSSTTREEQDVAELLSAFERKMQLEPGRNPEEILGQLLAGMRIGGMRMIRAIRTV